MRCIILLITISIFILTPIFSENLLKNPGMEDSDSTALHWRLDQFRNDGSIVKIEKENAHSGNNCVSIENIEQNDARLLQAIDVKENAIYKISGWIRTENVSFEGFGANLSFNEHWFISDEIEGTQDKWQFVYFYLTNKKNITKLDFCLRLGGYGGISTGKAYFDDIKIEEVKTIPPGSREFTIGSSKEDSQQDERINTSNPENENVIGNKPQIDPKAMESIIIVYTLIGLAIIVFILELILVNPKNRDKE